MDLAFEWDPSKERSNLEKHRIGFTEATSVFGDSLARIFVDQGHSTDELREIIVGHSQAGRLLLVCFTELAESRIRIIGARRATRREQYDYENQGTVH